MKTTDIISMSARPAIYEKGTAFMWTDEHISKQLLNTHLNPDIDLASRKQTSIEKTVDWILGTQGGNEKLNILDLGCGPGLYAELLAKEGHNVTGVDISETSINYARQSAKEKGLGISYVNASYLDIDFMPGQYDLVLLIYTDFGALSPTGQGHLLGQVYRALKKGGTFIFDVLKDNGLENKIAPNTWEASNGGFWSPAPYVMLSQSFLYEKEKVALFQNILIDENDKTEIYRFWTHFFNEKDIERKLKKGKFANIRFNDQVLADDGPWNGDNVLFAISQK